MKTIVITGATSGIGFAAARALVKSGFRVIGIGHDTCHCHQAEERIAAECPEGSFFCLTADLMQQREVLRVADELAEHLTAESDGELYALINNAGCVRSWHTTTEEGFEQQFALNYLAAFLLTHRLLPYLLKAHGRVIMTGSQSHKGIKVRWDDVMLTKRYNPLAAYKQSKLCCILFARGFNDRFASRVRAYVVDPGLVNTDIGNKNSGGLVNLIWTIRKKHGVSPDIPAQTYAFLCAQPSAPEGLYYYQCRDGCQERTFSRQVTDENADRLFALSERLCGVSYDSEEVTA